MAQLLINIGAAPNDKTGDPARTAFDKVNQNFTELFGQSGGVFKQYTQTGHTLSNGQPVYRSGGLWVPADAAASATVARGIVEVVDANTINVYTGGPSPALFLGLGDGVISFLAVGGGLTTVEPTGINEMVQPLVYADSSTTGLLFPVPAFASDAEPPP